MPVLFNKYYPVRDIIFFLGEGWLIFMSILLANWFFQGGGIFMIDLAINCLQALVVTSVFQLCLYFFDLYDLKKDTSMPDTFTRIMQAFGVGCILLGSLYYLLPTIIISTRIFWLGYLVICATVFIWRAVYYSVLRRKLFVQQVVIIGTGRLASDIAMEIEGRHDSVYKVVAFIGRDEPRFNPNAAPVYHKLEDLSDRLHTLEIERIIVALDDRRGVTPLATLLQCKIHGIAIEHGVSFYERATGKILVERVDPSWLIFSEGFGLSRWRYLVKRIGDVVFSVVLLTFSLPVMVMTALIIKLESRGSIFYIQERVGWHGIPFKVIKFRSMCEDAEQNGAVWAAKNDSRVTRCGAFIRKVRIDELPQLWNVIKGEMSLVGPRPERAMFVEELIKSIPFYGMRHDVKPGLTGWAQICYPYGASSEDALRKLEYDLYYVKNMSIALDLLVIFHTIKTVLFQKGSR